MRLSKITAIGIAAAGLAVAAISAADASTLMPVQNLTFDQFNSPTQPPKNLFSLVNPTFWQRGSLPSQSDLVFIDAPGTATTAGPNNSFAVYGPLNDPPPGGNFVEADGNPDYESTFFQVINGLTIGETYTLSFWQAGSQQQGFSGPTTELWKVFFGDGNITLANPVGDTLCPLGSVYHNCYGVNVGANDEQDSAKMSTASQSYTDWNQVNMSFVANAASETLTFLAWGDDGSNVNLPPTLLLAGVNTPSRSVPEPATLSLLGAGVAGAWLRRRAKRKA